jgi:plasmid stabilization system protein ParE
MKRRVLLTPQAKQDITAAYLYIRADAPEAARRWRFRLRQLIRTLATFSERHEISAEGNEVGVALRQMLYGSYRVLYTVEEKSVRIHALRHGACRPLLPDEVQRMTWQGRYPDVDPD